MISWPTKSIKIGSPVNKIISQYSRSKIGLTILQIIVGPIGAVMVSMFALSAVDCGLGHVNSKTIQLVDSESDCSDMFQWASTL